VSLFNDDDELSDRCKPRLKAKGGRGITAGLVPPLPDPSSGSERGPSGLKGAEKGSTFSVFPSGNALCRTPELVVRRRGGRQGKMRSLTHPACGGRAERAQRTQNMGWGRNVTIPQAYGKDRLERRK